MSLANAEVKTAAELKDTVHAIFEKALTQVQFCDTYAEACEELEAKCSTKNMTSYSTWDGLTYSLLKAVSNHRSARPFHEPVDTTIVVDYLEFIKEPVDLQLISERIDSGAYISKAALEADLEKMCDNCTTYNTPDTNYYKATVDLREFIQSRIQIRKDELQMKYYVSTPTVLCGPYERGKAALRYAPPVRTVLLQCCQRELGTTSNQFMDRLKQRKLGTCHFLGALFRRGFVEASTMHRCIEALLDVRQKIAGNLELLNPGAAPDEVNLEALCTLLESKSVGERLESQIHDPLASKHYWMLKSKLNGNVRLSPKLAARVQAVIDLRALLNFIQLLRCISILQQTIVSTVRRFSSVLGPIGTWT